MCRRRRRVRAEPRRSANRDAGFASRFTLNAAVKRGATRNLTHSAGPSSSAIRGMLFRALKNCIANASTLFAAPAGIQNAPPFTIRSLPIAVPNGGAPGKRCSKAVHAVIGIASESGGTASINPRNAAALTNGMSLVR